MQRDVELSGGPLAGAHWPVRLESDRTLWIGIGADGGEYDGRSRLKAIAIYERAGSEDRPRFDFARLEGPGARIAELGRRITRLRANWRKQRGPPASPSATAGQTSPAPRRPATAAGRPLVDAERIAGRVYERWLRAVEALPTWPLSHDERVRIRLIVPDEAEQLRDMLKNHGITGVPHRSTIEVRDADGQQTETLEIGAVEIQAGDVSRVLNLLRELTAVE